MKPKRTATCYTLLHDKNHEDSHIRHNLFNNDLNLGQLGHKKQFIYRCRTLYKCQSLTPKV